MKNLSIDQLGEIQGGDKITCDDILTFGIVMLFVSPVVGAFSLGYAAGCYTQQ